MSEVWGPPTVRNIKSKTKNQKILPQTSESITTISTIQTINTFVYLKIILFLLLLRFSGVCRRRHRPQIDRDLDGRCGAKKPWSLLVQNVFTPIDAYLSLWCLFTAICTCLSLLTLVCPHWYLFTPTDGCLLVKDVHRGGWKGRGGWDDVSAPLICPNVIRVNCDMIFKKNWKQFDETVAHVPKFIFFFRLFSFLSQ